MTESLICIIEPGSDSLSPGQRRRLLRDGIKVVVEHRSAERRTEADRRADGQRIGDTEGDNRRIRNAGGRRVGERRAPLKPVAAKALPDRLVPYTQAEAVAFVRRLEPTRQQREDLDDLRLIVRLQSGDQGAFDSVYERHLRRLHSYASAALADPIEAEDVAQEAFLRMLEALPGYEVTGVPFRIWLFRVLRNLVVDRLRESGQTVLEPPELIGERLEQIGAAEAEHGAESGGITIEPASVMALLEEASENTILHAVANLPPAQRQVIVLRYLLDLDTQEIAKALGATPNAVASRQHRAVRTLRERFAPHRDVRAGQPELAMVGLTQISPVLGARLYLT